jgi:hypothetical protein
MADCRRRQVQASRGAPDVTLVNHDPKKNQKIEVGPSEMSQIQHTAESISLASAIAKAHDESTPDADRTEQSSQQATRDLPWR